VLFAFPFDFGLHLLPKLPLIWLAEMRIGKGLHLDGGYLAISLRHDVVKSSHPTIDKEQVKYDQAKYQERQYHDER
jgi:hypothetical protein